MENTIKAGWHEGTMGIPTSDGHNRVAHYWVKTYDESSEEYGLNGGKISKLSIKVNGEWVANYDRGWDIKPDENDEMMQISLAILMKEYN